MPAMPLPTTTRRSLVCTALVCTETSWVLAIMFIAGFSGSGGVCIGGAMPGVKEAQDFAAAVGVGRVIGQIEALARPFQGDVEDFADRGGGTVGHHDDAVGQQHRLVHV